MKDEAITLPGIVAARTASQWTDGADKSFEAIWPLIHEQVPEAARETSESFKNVFRIIYAMGYADGRLDQLERMTKR